MFELPDDDGFWDDFCLEEDNSGNATSKPSAGPASSFSVTEAGSSNENRLSTKVPKPNNVESPGPSSSSLPGRSKRRCERKFPGPAGLLPAMPPLGQLSSSAVELVGVVPGPASKETHTEEVDKFPSSQSQSDDVCSSLQWKRMMEDLGNDAESLLNKFSIKSLLLRVPGKGPDLHIDLTHTGGNKASRKMLSKGKAPLVFGVIETMDLQGADAGFVIRDQTGRMKGSLHKDLIQDPGTALQAGCVLILRQVSVISPSARTHYLNVTPGNIVFAYTPTKNAAAAKRPWRSPTSTSEGVNKDLESSPSLHDIIAESERELSESIRNFHNNQRRGLSSRSPTVSSIGSPSLFSTGMPRQLAPLPGNNRAFQARPIRPGGNPHPFGASSRPQGYNSVSRFPNNCMSESPLPTTKSFSNPGFRQPLTSPSVSGGHHRFGSEESKSYMVTGKVAVRQNNNVQSNHKVGENSGQNLRNNVGHSSRQVNNLNSGYESHDFEFDFPEDNEDGELLQFCDETLSKGENICGGINTEKSLNQREGQTYSSVISTSHRVASSVISKVFRDCENENRDTRFENKPTENLNFVERKSSSGKTSTFKRNSPSSCSIDNDSVSSFPTKRKCMGNQQPLTLNQTHGTNLVNLPIQPSMHLPSTEKVALKGLGKSNGDMQCDRQRDSRVQLGQKPPSATKMLPTHTDALSHWDDGEFL